MQICLQESNILFYLDLSYKTKEATLHQYFFDSQSKLVQIRSLPLLVVLQARLMVERKIESLCLAMMGLKSDKHYGIFVKAYLRGFRYCSLRDKKIFRLLHPYLTLNAILQFNTLNKILQQLTFALEQEIRHQFYCIYNIQESLLMTNLQMSNQPKDTSSQTFFSRSGNVIRNQRNHRKNDLMKFLFQSKPDRQDLLRGKRCFSNNNAVSNDSPDHFKISKPAEPNLNKTTRLHKACANPESAPQSEKTTTQINQFYPQKNYFDVGFQTSGESAHEFLKQYTDTLHMNTTIFNKKISEYSGFVQQNVFSQWGEQYPLMGMERSKQGRKVNNKNRDKIIEEKQRTMQVFLKTFHTNRSNRNQISTGQNTKYDSFSGQPIRTKNDLLFGQKVRVRKNRNQIANKLHMDTQSYLIREAQVTDNNIRTFYSVQSSKDNAQNRSRPLTGVKRSRSTVVNRNQMFDTLLGKFGMKTRQNHRNQSTIDNSDVANQSHKKMVKNMQVWDQHHGKNVFIPCTSSFKKLKSSHKKNLSFNETSAQRIRNLMVHA